MGRSICNRHSSPACSLIVRFDATPIDGAFFVKLDPHEDERGLFARTFCEQEFASAGVSMSVIQANISRNPKVRTLRGMHFQAAPSKESKIVQCVRGRIFDVAIDLRAEASSFRKVVCAELSAAGQRMFFIPPGCAHGFLTLEDNSDVLYYMGSAFVPGAGRGLRWNDPAFDIPWPFTPLVISERDANYPDYSIGRVGKP
jgi:dTDP-4-dehydrorhamnose 3,5-epimerase